MQFWTRSWARRLYNCMWFVWKTAKTVKVDIAGASKEAELKFLNGIVNKVENFEIPPSLVLNLGQINSKYVYTDKNNNWEERSTSVTIGGLSDKEA